MFQVYCSALHIAKYNFPQAALQPELLGGEFTHLDYNRRPNQRDLGKRILYRDAHMTGWAYKTVTPEDLKIPVVYGEGKRVRILIVVILLCVYDHLKMEKIHVLCCFFCIACLKLTFLNDRILWINTQRRNQYRN